MNATERPQIHISTLNTLDHCGIKFFMQQIEKQREIPSWSQLRGRAAHAAFACTMKLKLNRGALPPWEEVADAAPRLVDEELGREAESGMVRMDKDPDGEPIADVDGIRSELINQFRDLGRAHYDTIARERTPLYVENKMTAPIQGLPFDIAGTADLISVNPDAAPGMAKVRIDDMKTAAASPPANAADKSAQLSMYALLSVANKLAAMDEIIPVGLAAFVMLKKGIKCAEAHSVRTVSHYMVLHRRLQHAAALIEAGQYLPPGPAYDPHENHRRLFQPADMGHYLCSPRYCGFYAVCPHVHEASAQMPVIINLKKGE